jgi:SAM-dependent methyltransferase
VEEVHLWRGSTEQRALRERLGRAGQFAYFDQQLGHPDWSQKLVLDFGGNAGNLLRDPACAIRLENYFCLDVIPDAVEAGREMFPRGHFIHYDRYNCSFNPGGAKDLPLPDLGFKFDVVLAFSVFTHIARGEMCELVDQLRAQLARDGLLAFTFIDPHARSGLDAYEGSNLQWRLERSFESFPTLDLESLLKKARGASWCSLVNGRELFVDSDGVWDGDAESCMTYNVFYTAETIERLFPNAIILPPVNGEMQHCCIIRA